MEKYKYFKIPKHAGLFLEGRVFIEFKNYFKCLPELENNYLGNGDTVLVFPGFLVGDIGTLLMRNFLNDIGFNAKPWKLGINRGPTRKVLVGVRDRIKELTDIAGEKISMVGWSLGGIYAREEAKENPDHIKLIITLGTPFAKGLNTQTVGGYFKNAGIDGLNSLTSKKINQLHVSPPQPYTSIYSKRDKVINWTTCVDNNYKDRKESIEVDSSHFGLCHNCSSLEIIADRLNQDLDNWKPYKKK